jgi:hypothetical protein
MMRRFPLPARRSFASIDKTTGSRSGSSGTLASRRRGDLRAVQVDVDPIGGYDHLLDNLSDEASGTGTSNPFNAKRGSGQRPGQIGEPQVSD